MIYYNVNDRGKGTQQCAPSFLHIAIGLQRNYLFFLRCSQQKHYSSRQALIDALKGWSESRAHSESKRFAEYGEDLQQSSERGHYPRASRAAALNTNKILQGFVLFSTMK